jgi:hypothetical protein
MTDADPATHRHWQLRLERLRRIGLTISDFCDREQVSVASFYAW